MATITGQRARSALPACDTPRDADGFSSRHDESSHAPEPAQSARAAWCAVTPRLAGTPHVRVSRDGGRTCPARHARPLPAEPPGQPCTVPVYEPATGTGRMLALDLDPGRCLSRPAVTTGRDSESVEANCRFRSLGARIRQQIPTAPPTIRRPGSALRRPSSGSCSIASAPGTSPTSRRAAAATSMSRSPLRCRGSTCGTSAAPWRSASPRSTQCRCPASAARSALPDPGTSPEAGGWSRCR